MLRVSECIHLNLNYCDANNASQYFLMSRAQWFHMKINITNIEKGTYYY